MKINTPTIKTLEFASNIREAHCLILQALDVLAKNDYLACEWTEDNGVLASLNLEVGLNLESVLFNHLFKVIDVIKSKGVDYAPIHPMEYGKVESSEFTSEPMSEELEAAYLAIRTKEILTNAQRMVIYNDNPALAKEFLHECGWETGENQLWLNTNIYSEYEKEVSDLRMEQGL